MNSTPSTVMPLSELVEGYLDSDITLSDTILVTGLSEDSRTLKLGDCFIANCAAKDVNQYVMAAIQSGAAAILVDNECYHKLSCLPHTVPLLPVKHLQEVTGQIASRFYGYPSRNMKVIGVTGTNGKSSITHFLAQILDELPEIGPCGIIGTLGNGRYGMLHDSVFTTPSPVLLHTQLHDFDLAHVKSVAMEVSSHGLDQHRVAGVDFDIAVFSNFTRDHLDYHGSLEAYFSAKKRLFLRPELRAVVINVDDPYGQSIYSEIPEKIHKWAYTFNGLSQNSSVSQNDRTIEVLEFQESIKGLNLKLRTSKGDASFSTAILGRFNVYNLMATLGVLLELEVPLSIATKHLSRLKPVSGRYERMGGDGKKPLVIIDYAHTPDALEKVLESLKRICTTGRLWCVFGCGGERDVGKRPQMGQIAQHYADYLVVTSDNPRGEPPAKIIQHILAGVTRNNRVHIETDRKKAILYALTHASAEDIVLIAGKGHERYQEIAGVRTEFSDRDVVHGIIYGVVS